MSRGSDARCAERLRLSEKESSNLIARLCLARVKSEPSLPKQKAMPERQSLSAHQAAKPQRDFMKEALIISAVRTAVGKAPRGTLRDTRPDEMGAAVIKEAMARVPGLEANEIEDVIMGCAMPEAEQGMNVARAAAIRAGLPVETSAMTINRFCSSGLQSIAMAADRIRGGGAETIVAGGLETMSMIPMGGHIIRPNPYLVEHYPDFYLSMGLATENVARKYNVSREEQ